MVGLGVLADAPSYRKRRDGSIDRSHIVDNDSGQSYQRRASFYKMAKSSPNLLDIDLYDSLYEYLSGFIHPDINTFDILGDSADQFGREPFRLFEAVLFVFAFVVMIADTIQQWECCGAEIRKDINTVTKRVAARIVIFLDRKCVNPDANRFTVLRARLKQIPTR
jgi:hypothetical protein